MVSVEQATRIRPANRKEQIAEVAAGLFCDLGYHRVAIDDIATAVGVTSRAIYRHFDNKADLLSHVVLDSVSRAELAMSASDDVRDPDAHLDTVINAFAATVQHNDGILIEREARHLEEKAASEVASRLAAIRERITTLLRGARPELSKADAAMLMRAAVAVIISPAYHSASTARSDELVAGMARTVLNSRSLPSTNATIAKFAKTRATQRASRREAVLTAAIELFAQHGYNAVRMEDIGAAAGIAGPSIYEHFDGKPDVLMAALTRGAIVLQVGMATVLSQTNNTDEALTAVLRSYIDCMLDQADLMAVLLTEVSYLPDEQRHEVRGVQHDYVAEWIHLLGQGNGDMTPAEARFRAHAALSIVNDHCRGGRQPRRADLRDVLTQLGREVLGL